MGKERKNNRGQVEASGRGDSQLYRPRDGEEEQEAAEAGVLVQAS